MPFPFRRLHADLQYRLRELARPSELAQLQLATGNVSTVLRPFHPCHFIAENTEFILSRGHNDELQLTYSDENRIHWLRNKVIFIKSLTIETEISEADTSFIKNLQLYAVLNIQRLAFKCDIPVDASMLRQIASLCSTKCRSIIFKTSDLQEDVSFPLIFKLFPKVKKLYIDVYRMRNWLQDLMKAKATGMKSLHVLLFAARESDAVFGKLNAEALYQFCKAQSPNFKLRLAFLSHNRLAPSIWNFLKPYFRQVRDGNDAIKIVIEKQLFQNEPVLCACYAEKYR